MGKDQGWMLQRLLDGKTSVAVLRIGDGESPALSDSWRRIRKKVRQCGHIEQDHIPPWSQMVQRPRFMTSSIEQQVHAILFHFIDDLITDYQNPPDYIARGRGFGRKLAGVLRTIQYDLAECWMLLETRVLHHLMAKHCHLNVLVAWQQFIGRLSGAVMDGFWHATLADLPKRLPTIFEETPTKCIHYCHQNDKLTTKQQPVTATSEGISTEMPKSSGMDYQPDSWPKRLCQDQCNLTAPMRPKVTATYRVLYAYTPRNSDELELQENDIVSVVEKCNDGWFIGTLLRTGQFGTFPGNYVEKR